MTLKAFAGVLSVMAIAAAPLNAGEFAVMNEDVTFTDSTSGFYFRYNPSQGPTNWISPDNYYNGQFYCRFEVISQPSSKASYLSFCIWGNAETTGTSPEVASGLSAALTGAGSVATFNSSPSTWWKQDGGVNFTNRATFYRWGIPHWGSNSPPILLAPKGYSTDSRSWAFWAERTNWLPLKVRVTVVAVSLGSAFSGWQNYIGPSDTQPPTVPGHLAVTSVRSNSISLDWTPSSDNVGVKGYLLSRNGSVVGTNASTGYLDTALSPNTTNTYTVRAYDAAGNQSIESAPVTAVTTSISLAGATPPARFTHFTIRDPLPGAAYGTAGIPMADFDGDGDMDCALSRRDVHGFWWYERRSDSNWVQHLINDSSSLLQGLGCAALDVDNDGWTDLVFDGVWFKNPGTLKQSPDAAWAVNPFGGAGHDIVSADVNRDGRNDIVVFNGNTLCWFNPASGMASNVVAINIGHHGGIGPAGAGDIDADGAPDVVIAGSWFRNPGNGAGVWNRFAWPHLVITNASYGTSIRSWVVDLDGDGTQDIVYSDCDTGYGHVYWVRNNGKGTNWTRIALPDPPTSSGSVPGTGSFHSLAVADFNLDGRLDIFAGEQEDPDQIGGGKLPMKPKGLKERGVVWINHGGSVPSFTPQVIQEDNPGWHDACLGDAEGDGDLDLVSKVWNKDGATYHADYWRNEAIVRLDNGADLSGWHVDGGLWQVVDGAIVGQQNPPGSGNGGLLLSDSNYGDFEATFEVWPDWGVDTGFYTRTSASGKAYQVTIDYQTNNPMGGVYLSGIGNTGFWDFTLTGTNSIEGNPQGFTVSDWPSIWNPVGWNTFKVQVTNNPPHIITWINGIKIEDYQDTQVRLSATGMVALQIHPTVSEWPNGAVTRFRNIRIKDLANNIPTPDSQFPSTPANLRVMATSGSSISLTWSPSTDNVGVTGYRIYRNGIETGTCIGTSFTDAGLTGNTAYAYAVRAYDAAANQSALSSIVSTNTTEGGSDGAVPTQGLAFWLNTEKGITLNGSNVSQWADQSSNNRHAIQATATSQPAFVGGALNGKPVLRFDGANDFLSFNLPINACTGLTMVLVSANTSSRDPGVNQGNYAPLFWDETASWGWTYLSPFQTNVAMRFGTTQAANLFKYQRPGTIGSGFSISIGVHNNTTDSLFIDGSLVMTASNKLAPIAATVNSPYIGRGANSTYFPGDIAEVLIYTRALSNAERVDIENYCRAKYFPARVPASEIISPGDGASYMAPAAIPVTVAASSPNGSIGRIEFFANGALIGERTTAPWRLDWTGVLPGSYTLTARVTDSVGATKTSDAITVTVTTPFFAPELSPIANRVIVGGARLAVTNHAYDANSPAQRLVFSLAEAPANAAIDPDSGAISWRPSVAQNAVSNRFTVAVRQVGGWETNLLPIADGYVAEAYPSANYGAQSSLNVKLSSAPGLTRESFLLFDLASVGGVVSDASLHLIPLLTSFPGTHALALVTNTGWSEASLTWGSKPLSGGVLGTWVPQEGVEVTVPLAGAVQSAIKSNGLLALRLYATNSTSDGLVYYGAREGMAQTAPRLFVSSTAPSLSATQSFWVLVNPPSVPAFAAQHPSADGLFRFCISGDAGPDYIIQASTNFLDWTPLLTSNLSTFPFEFTDRASSNFQSRFYRVSLGP